MSHDADMPFTPEAWLSWASATQAEKAMAFVALDWQPRGNTRRFNRWIMRGHLYATCSSYAFRVAGMLNGKHNVTRMGDSAIGETWWYDDKVA